jgi:hypothetical protein
MLYDVLKNGEKKAQGLLGLWLGALGVAGQRQS